MTACVVDASIVAAVFFQEEHADRAVRVLLSGAELLAPELIYAELASVIWKRYGRGEIVADEAQAMLDDVKQLTLKVWPIRTIVGSALSLAVASGRTVYDCLYLTLAIEHECVMWTADRRLVNALADSPVADHVRWIGEFR